MKCVICEQKIDNYRTNKKYCSRKCKAKKYYGNHKQQIIGEAKRWQQQNPEKTRIIHEKAMLKFRTEKKEQFNALINKNRLKNKKKWNARVRANQQVVMNSNQKCELCGSQKKIQKHHPDYDKPLDIIFLCEKCHKNHHKQERNRLLVEWKERRF